MLQESPLASTQMEVSEVEGQGAVLSPKGATVTSAVATMDGCPPFAPLPEVLCQRPKSRNKVPVPGCPVPSL